MQMRGTYTLILVLIGLIMLSSLPLYAKSRAWCRSQDLPCVRVKRGQSWHALFPDERERGMVMRINRTNGRLYPGMMIAVPDDLADADLLDYSPLPRMIKSVEEKAIIIDLAVNAWGAYDERGTLIRWGPATGGADWCHDIDKECRTKSGHFRIYSLGSSNCVSTKFPIDRGGAPMPYCMFFNGGQALHGSPGQVMRGNVSHGCVRLFVDDAEWLRYDFVDPPNAENGYRGTKVVVLPY